MVSSDIKALIDNDATTKQMVISFPDADGVADIENDRIYSEDFRIEEILSDNNDLTFGICASNLMTVKVADFTDDVRRENITVDVTFTNPNTTVTSYTMRLFTGVVSNVQRSGDRRFKIITATDYMNKFAMDIAEWYNTVLFPTDDTTRTMAYIIDALCAYIGVSYNNTHFSTLPFQSLEITKNLQPTRLSARSFLRQLCEINACMGHFDNDGILDFIMITNKNPLFPSLTLLPSESLYPSANTYISGFETENISLYISTEFDDYDVAAINSVQLRDENDIISYTSDTPEMVKPNRYIVTGNSFIYGLSDENIQRVANEMLGNIKDFPYRAFNLTMKGGVYIPLGSPVDVTARYYDSNGDPVDVTFNSYVLNRTISGVQGMNTTISATGNDYRSEIDEDITDDFQIIRGKLADVQTSVEDVQTSVEDVQNTDVLKVNNEGIVYNVSLGEAASSGNPIKIGGWTIDTNDLYSTVTTTSGAYKYVRSIRLDGDDGAIICTEKIYSASGSDYYGTATITFASTGVSYEWEMGSVLYPGTFPLDDFTIDKWGITFDSGNIFIGNNVVPVVEGTIGIRAGGYAYTSDGVYKRTNNVWTQIL